jgi:hypothetical protein
MHTSSYTGISAASPGWLELTCLLSATLCRPPCGTSGELRSPDLLARFTAGHGTTIASAPGRTAAVIGVRPKYSPSVQTGRSGSLSIMISLPCQYWNAGADLGTQPSAIVLGQLR